MCVHSFMQCDAHQKMDGICKKMTGSGNQDSRQWKADKREMGERRQVGGPTILVKALFCYAYFFFAPFSKLTHLPSFSIFLLSSSLLFS